MPETIKPSSSISRDNDVALTRAIESFGKGRLAERMRKDPAIVTRFMADEHKLQRGEFLNLLATLGLRLVASCDEALVSSSDVAALLAVVHGHEQGQDETPRVEIPVAEYRALLMLSRFGIDFLTEKRIR